VLPNFFATTYRTFSSAESLMEAVRVMNKAPNPELDDPNATFSSKNPQKQDCNSGNVLPVIFEDLKNDV